MKTGYILIADILGFSNIVRNLEDRELEIRIKDWINLIKTLSDKYEFKEYKLLSDTLFLSCEGNQKPLFENLVNFSIELLDQGLDRMIPIKGSITYGNYEWGDLIYGKPIIEGHMLENNQNWIGITLQNDVPNVDELWDNRKIVCYPSPMKTGVIRLHPVIAWNPPSSEQIIIKTTNKGLVKPKEYMEWTWADKIKNTVDFKIYIEILRSMGANGKEFNGFLPFQTIELNIKKPNA